MPMTDFQTTVNTRYLDALKQIARSAEALIEAEDAFILREREKGRGDQHWTSPRVHMARVALARDLASLGDFDA